MQWLVRGADRETGQDRELIIDADTQDSAERRAGRRGLLVAQVNRMPVVADSAAGMPAIGVATYPPHAPVQVAVGVNIPHKGTSGFGIAALVLGIIAVLFCWVPLVGMLAIPFAVIGVILAGVGFLVSLLGRKSSIGMPVAGGVICIAAIIVAIVSTGGTVAAVGNAVAQSNAQSHRTNQTVVSPSAPSAAGALPNATAPTVTTPPVTPQVEWAPAASPVRNGDVQIRIVSAKVAKVPVKTITGDESASTEPHLAITVELANKSTSKKLNYSSWGGSDISFGRDYATVQDDQDNVYKRIGFGMNAPVGRSDQASIYPGKSISDVLVFESPIDGVKFLNLEMPAKNFGGDGMIRFTIPASMIERTSANE